MKCPTLHDAAVCYNTMAKRRRKDNTMAKRRRTDNAMAKRRTDNTMAKKERQSNGQKDRQYNDQKKTDRQYNDQKKTDRQYNDQKEKGQTTIYKTLRKLKLSNTNPSKTVGELRCSGEVSSSFSTCDTRRVILLKDSNILWHGNHVGQQYTQIIQISLIKHELTKTESKEWNIVFSIEYYQYSCS
jgi:hypothetical protein